MGTEQWLTLQAEPQGEALQRKLERQARSMGARFFGVADLTAAQEAIVAQGGEFLAAFPRALAVGIALSDTIVDQLPRHKELAVARTYDYLLAAAEAGYRGTFELSYKVSPGRTIAEADVVAFAGLSGDFNPLHTDAEFAKRMRFGARIAHGLLGLVSRLGFVEGTVEAFLGLNWKFKAPIMIGDTAVVRAQVAQTKAMPHLGGGSWPSTWPWSTSGGDGAEGAVDGVGQKQRWISWARALAHGGAVPQTASTSPPPAPQPGSPLPAQPVVLRLAAALCG